jgi:hypothetical protein
MIELKYKTELLFLVMRMEERKCHMIKLKKNQRVLDVWNIVITFLYFNDKITPLMARVSPFRLLSILEEAEFFF